MAEPVPFAGVLPAGLRVLLVEADADVREMVRNCGPELARQATARWLGLAVLLMSRFFSQPVAAQDAGRHAWRLL